MYIYEYYVLLFGISIFILIKYLHCYVCILLDYICMSNVYEQGNIRNLLVSMNIIIFCSKALYNRMTMSTKYLYNQTVLIICRYVFCNHIFIAICMQV